VLQRGKKTLISVGFFYLKMLGIKTKHFWVCFL